MIIEDGMQVCILHTDGKGNQTIKWEGTACESESAGKDFFSLKEYDARAHWRRDRTNPIIGKCVTVEALE